MMPQARPMTTQQSFMGRMVAVTGIMPAAAMPTGNWISAPLSFARCGQELLRRRQDPRGDVAKGHPPAKLGRDRRATQSTTQARTLVDCTP
jgi:hypothetical protein